MQNDEAAGPVYRLGCNWVDSPLRAQDGRPIVSGTMARVSHPIRRSPCRLRSFGAVILFSWFLVGHPLALYADSLDELDGPAASDGLARKTRADIAVPLPDPLQPTDEDNRRLHPHGATVARLEGIAALEKMVGVRAAVTLRRLSTVQSPPRLFPIQVAPSSCRDGEPPHAA